MSDDVEGLHGPLERFASIHQAAQRGRTATIDLSYPNATTHRDRRAFDLLRTLLRDSTQDSLQYTPFGGRTVPRRRVAAALSRRSGVSFGFRDVFLTPGATAALSVTFETFFAPGDEIVVVTPCWMDYHLYLTRLGLRVVEVPAGVAKRLDVAALAAACGPRTAGVVISQPACPTGVVSSAAELQALGEVLRDASRRSGRPVVLVSDEAHRDQIWDGGSPHTPARFHPHSVAVHSFGKAWSLQGQRTGYLALGPGLQHDGARTQVDRTLRASGFCAPTALMQQLVTEIADLDPDQGPLRAAQLKMRAVLRTVGLDPVPAEGTAFVYVPCPAGVDDWTFVAHLARHGVLTMPSSVFHEAGHFRLALNVGPESFDEIAMRMRGALTALRATTNVPG